MLSSNLRVTGFDAATWGRFISLFESRKRARHHPDDHRNSYGALVVVEDSSGAACAAFIGDRGPVDASDYRSREDLEALCMQHRVKRGIALRLGAMEELAERATAQMLRTDDYAGQWLALLGAARELEREGSVYFWPQPRNAVPLPTPQLLTRALDVVLPDERSFVAALWEESELWTALVLRRRGGQFDLIGGPELVLDMVGPLSGDYRRDHRAVSRAISSSIAPLQLGIYAQRRRFQRLLREAEPGAWAKAVALREVIIDPSPAYVHFAVGADALRATARKTGELLGGIDFIGFLEPWTRYAREQVSAVASVTGMLGFNPLQVLARRLRANEEGLAGDSLAPVPDDAPDVPDLPDDAADDTESGRKAPLPETKIPSETEPSGTRPAATARRSLRTQMGRSEHISHDVDRSGEAYPEPETTRGRTIADAAEATGSCTDDPTEP